MGSSVKVLHWIPRVMCMLAIVFISLFAFDAFDPKYTFWQQVGAFIIHLIPSFILIALLILAWRWELVGGIIFSIIGIAFSPFIFIWNYEMNESIWMSISIISMITIPFLVVGILFIVDYYSKKKHKET